MRLHYYALYHPAGTVTVYLAITGASAAEKMSGPIP